MYKNIATAGNERVEETDRSLDDILNKGCKTTTNHCNNTNDKEDKYNERFKIFF
jgi:hypothetical protein